MTLDKFGKSFHKHVIHKFLSHPQTRKLHFPKQEHVISFYGDGTLLNPVLPHPSPPNQRLQINTLPTESYYQNTFYSGEIKQASIPADVQILINGKIFKPAGSFKPEDIIEFIYVPPLGTAKKQKLAPWRIELLVLTDVRD